MKNEKTFLILGSNGQLAREFQRVFSLKKINFYAPKEDELDITDQRKVKKAIQETKPRVVINCAAYNFVDEAEKNPLPAFAVNGEAVKDVAGICRETKTFFVHYSSDYVFDGKKNAPYSEEDRLNPINVYGKSKLEGEEAVKNTLQDYLIFRLSWVFGDGKQNFLYKLAKWGGNEKVLNVTADEVSTPTYTEDVVVFTLLALKKKLSGLYHLTNSGFCSRYEWAKYFFDKMGKKHLLQPVSLENFSMTAKRPLFSALSNAKLSKALGQVIPTWEDSVSRYIMRNKAMPVND